MSGLEMKYFILKPKGTNEYAKASRAAMRRYARVISSTNEELAKELLEWAEREFEKALDENMELTEDVGVDGQ